MSQEFAVKHLGILRRLTLSMKGIRSRMHADESCPRVNPLLKKGHIRDGKCAGGIEENNPIIGLECLRAHLGMQHILHRLIVGLGINAGTTAAGSPARVVLVGLGRGFLRWQGKTCLHRADRSQIQGEGPRSFSQLLKDLFSHFNGAMTESLGHTDQEEFLRIRSTELAGW